MVLRIEDISFIGIYINDSFRDFKDINDYANYHVSLLNNKRYQAFNGDDFIDRVVKGGYATAPNYKQALSKVYNQIAKGQNGWIAKIVNKAKEILPKEEPKEPINVINVAKEYAPSIIGLAMGNFNPLIDKIFSNKEQEIISGEVQPLSYSNTLNYIKALENPHEKGMNRATGIARNYDANTAGYGTDYVNGPHRHLKQKIKSGKWTIKEAEDTAVKDMRTHDKVIMKNMKDYTNRPDTISEGPRLLMAQSRYHYGNIKKSFPEWAEAVATGDANKQKELALKLAKGYNARYDTIKNIDIYEDD